MAREKSVRRSSRAAPVSVHAEEDALPDLTPLVMGGRFVDDVTAVARTDSELFLGTGRLATDWEPLLVPFVDMTFLGVQHKDIDDAEDEPALTPVFQKTLTLENALWLAFDVIRDIRAECVTLGKLAGGEVGIDPARLAHARFFAEKAREQAEMCVTLFDELAQSMTGTSSAGDSVAEDAAAMASLAPESRRSRTTKKRPKTT